MREIYRKSERERARKEERERAREKEQERKRAKYLVLNHVFKAEIMAENGPN